MNDSINQIINYIFNTPENTNYFVLISLLENLVQSNFPNIDFLIEDGNLHTTYENLNINFFINENGDLVYSISS